MASHYLYPLLVLLIACLLGCSSGGRGTGSIYVNDFDDTLLDWHIPGINGKLSSMTFWKETKTKKKFWDCLVVGVTKAKIYWGFEDLYGKMQHIGETIAGGRLIYALMTSICEPDTGKYKEPWLNKMDELCVQKLKEASDKNTGGTKGGAKDHEVLQSAEDCVNHLETVVGQVQQLLYMMRLVSETIKPSMVSKLHDYRMWIPEKSKMVAGNLVRMVAMDLKLLIDYMQTQADNQQSHEVFIQIYDANATDPSTILDSTEWQFSAQVKFYDHNLSYRTRGPTIISIPK